MSKSIPPSEPRGTVPERFPRLKASIAFLILLALVFGGTPLVNKVWGLTVALAYELATVIVWTVCFYLWLALRGRGKRG